MWTAQMTTAPKMTALLISAALLAGCSGATGASAGGAGASPRSGAQTASPTTAPSQSPSSSTPASAVAGIPDGAWVREITKGEIARRGLHLSPKEMTANYLDDGKVQLVLKTLGKRWSILVQDDAGAYEVGDLGSTSYDAQGRWVQSSDATGSALLLVWKLDGKSLITSGLASPDGQPIDDGTHLVTEGTWHRQA
jgi:hypothetical protein